MDEVFAPITSSVVSRSQTLYLERVWLRETTSSARCDYLAMMIEDFLVDFKELYPERPLTPKMRIFQHGICSDSD